LHQRGHLQTHARIPAYINYIKYSCQRSENRRDKNVITNKCGKFSGLSDRQNSAFDKCVRQNADEITGNVASQIRQRRDETVLKRKIGVEKLLLNKRQKQQIIIDIKA